jgi:hypothetical protein
LAAEAFREPTKIIFITKNRAAQPQPQLGISRAKRAKGAKEERCHFERREKSFLDPSHSPDCVKSL